MKLAGRLTCVAELSADERRQMRELMDRHYANLQATAFEADLSEKHWVIQIVAPESGQLCGFSTQMLLEVVVDQRPVTALFSGDTIVDPRYWGDSALSHVWGRLALSLIDRQRKRELYWFLIAQGYKTYRFLPVFFHEFYPRYDAATPARIRRVIDALARHKSPQAYDPAAGVIRASARQYRLRAGVADLTPGRLRDPHVQHFAQLNPGHVTGDELCCLAPLTRANFTPAAYRVIGPERAKQKLPAAL